MAKKIDTLPSGTHSAAFTPTLRSSGRNRIYPTSNTTLINVACSNRVHPRFVRDCSYGLVQRYSTSSCSASSSVIVGCYG